MEKWEYRKNFNFPHFWLVGWKCKNGGIENVNLYKFTHIPLLKNDAQLKPKKVINKKKKKNQSPNLLKNKNHVHKKITS